MADLLKLIPPLDVPDPKAFISAAVALFERYPAEVMIVGVIEIPRRSDRPTLKLMGEVLDEAYAPIQRAEARRKAAESHQRALPPPREKRTPEDQARIDAQVEEARRRFPLRPRLGDISGHAERVQADLDARRQRGEGDQ